MSSEEGGEVRVLNKNYSVVTREMIRLVIEGDRMTRGYGLLVPVVRPFPHAILFQVVGARCHAR